MNTIYIRADMNSAIASGHIMRCLSIADEVKKLGYETVFLTADEEPQKLIKSRGHRVKVLNTDWKNMEEELPVLLDYIAGKQIRTLLVDSYQVTYGYLQSLQEHTRVIYLDDLDSFEYPVDSVICYAPYYDKLSYPQYKHKTNFYLGTAYMPLRKVYQNCPPKQIKDSIERILVLSGGSDNYGMLDKIVGRLKENRGWQLEVVCGAFYPDFDGLREKYKEYRNISFCRNVPDLEEYMKRADLAISAGGTTLYELSAVGTPTVSYSFADNQLNNVSRLSEDGIIDYAGDVRRDAVYENISAFIEQYGDVELRKERSRRMQSLVDGKGAQRLAELLL